MSYSDFLARDREYQGRPPITTRTPLVVFHSPCMDGFTAAWACWLLHPDWEYVPGVYGQAPPDVTGREVYLLDFSYKRDVIVQMLRSANNITVLDHHVTAKEDLEPLLASGKIKGVFDMEHSGAYLAWRWFHSELNMPFFVRLVEDRDLWRFQLPNSKALNAAFFSLDYNFNTWNRLRWDCEEPDLLRQMILQGVAIERKQAKDIAEMLPKLRSRMNLGGVEVWVANLPYIFSSDAAQALCYDDKTFGATYYINSAGAAVFSLRSKEDGMDVSIIAKQMGGGGHKHAAGFTMPGLATGEVPDSVLEILLIPRMVELLTKAVQL